MPGSGFGARLRRCIVIPVAARRELHARKRDATIVAAEAKIVVDSPAATSRSRDHSLSLSRGTTPQAIRSPEAPPGSVR